MTNKFFRNDLKEFIELFASKKEQYEMWFLRDEESREDPNELYSMLYDDFGVENFVYAKDNYLTQKENNALKIFIDKLNVYGGKYKDEKGFLDFDSQKVYNDPEWDKIRQQAQKLYDLLEKAEGVEELPIIEDFRY